MITYLFTACVSQNPPTKVITDGNGFLGDPWPSDLRLDDGRADMSRWEHQGDNPLLDAFVEETKKVYGFGTNSPVYFQLDSVPELSVLPTETTSIDESSPIHIIDIDPNSPFRGERFPLRWDFQERETHWQPNNLLSIAPTWGLPLRPSTTYAAILTTDLIDHSGPFPEVWKRSHHLYEHYQPLAETWLSRGYSIDDIGYATIFTTQNPLYDLINISKRIDEELSIPPINQQLYWRKEGNNCQYYNGSMLIPLWQFGEKPYASEGGYFGYNEEGRPIVAEWEKVKFRISVPNKNMPEQGWPVAIYSHGTGGAYYTFANQDTELEVATQLSAIGMVGIGISQPIHADRGTGADPELYSFNYLNPPSARTMFRQGAADQIYLSKVLSSQINQLTADDGASFLLNPDKIHYIGHSHGGEVGALALPFMNKYLQSAVLSGTGGALSITLMERDMGDQGLDLEQLFENALSLESHEIVSPFHPAIALIQMLAEVTDPLNYARYWFNTQGYWESNPIPILMTEGLHDEYTPPKSIEILAAAARIPIIGDVHSLNPAQQILGHEYRQTATLNTVDYNGNPITAGLVQYPEDGHFPIFQNQEAADLYRSFLESANLSEASIDP